MDEPVTLEQAKKMDFLLREMGKHLFTIEDDPVAELPLAQLRVCAVLHGGLRPMSALSRELGVSVSAMTQIADRLERAGLVNRVAAGTDRRVRHLQLTERGEEIMRLREDARVQRVLAALQRLSPKVRKGVLASLEMFVGACGAGKGQDAVTEQTGQRSARGCG